MVRLIKPKKTPSKLLTETELEMMRVLWQRKEGTVHDVMDGLSAGRKLAYTSVSTILRILEQKEVVGSRKDGRGHIYFPKLGKKEYELRSLGHLMNNVFEGETLQLVSRLLELKDLDAKELENLRALLEAKGK